MNFKSLTENVTKLPGYTVGVVEKLRTFFEDQLPQPYWDEYSQSEITDSPDPGSVHSVTDSAFNDIEKNDIGFEADISFSKEPHAKILSGLAEKIVEFGGIGLDIEPTVTNAGLGVSSTLIRFRDGQGFGLATVNTTQSDPQFYPRHTIMVRRRQRPH